MAVQVDAKDIANASPDVKARNPQLYAKGGPASSQPAKPARQPVKKGTRKPTPKPSPTPTRTRKAPPQPTRRQRVQRVATQRVQRTAAYHANRVGGGIGAVLVLLTGAGITFAIIRNPALITTPVSFIGTVISKMTSFGGNSTPMRAIPVSSVGNNK